MVITTARCKFYHGCEEKKDKCDHRFQDRCQIAKEAKKILKSGCPVLAALGIKGIEVACDRPTRRVLAHINCENSLECLVQW